MEIVRTQVIHYVEDMAAAKRFYVEILGLKIIQDGGPHWLELDAGGTSIALHPGGTPRGRGRTGLSFAVEDLESARDEVNTRGAGFGEVTNPHPGVTFCEAADPDGNPVFLKPSR
ncbi:MAG: VOC family protein [Armatimonadetes bacterium]|nr:VOC family protein [Armatimonadota bacterium]MBX3109598.1 VOC family protein [Fimbriimonadaceae bacterium]